MHEALLGFDARVPGGGDPEEWDADRREGFLRRADVRSVRSVDVMVWPSLFDREAGAGRELPAWKGPNDGLWDDLSALKGHLPDAPAYWLVGVSVLCHRKFGGPLPPYLTETQPAEPEGGWTFLGWDVADAYRLSGLSNCGIPSGQTESERSRWAGALNEHHLFMQANAASAFRRQCDRTVAEHRPFFVYGLWRVVP
jgi:hypothetical protein